jgi:hypothetical protein
MDVVMPQLAHLTTLLQRQALIDPKLFNDHFIDPVTKRSFLHLTAIVDTQRELLDLCQQLCNAVERQSGTELNQIHTVL